MQAVLMVAGKSTRTYPLTVTRPKPLLPIANRAIIFHSLDQLRGLFDEVILIVGYRQQMIRQLLGDRYKELRLIYQEQKEQLGTGHAILQARPHIRGRFVAMNGDDLFAHQDLAALQAHSYAALAQRVADPSIYGVCQVDEHNRLLNMVEKPKTFISDLANIGCYIFEPEIFDVLQRVPVSERGEIEIIDAILAIAKKRDFLILPITGFWLPTGYAWDLLKHQHFMMAEMKDREVRGNIDEGVEMSGAVTVGKGSHIAAGCRIEGPVIIGEGCRLEPHCCIGKYTAIGDGCHLGSGTVVEASILFANVTVAEGVRIYDAVIGQGCRLGAGTVIENRAEDGATVRSLIKGQWIDSGCQRLGAILADGVQTGKDTVIKAGCKIWPNAIVPDATVIATDYIPEDSEARP